MTGSRKLVSCLVAVLFVFAVALPAFTADQKVEDELTIKAALWATPTKAPVKLTHKKHAEDHKVPCAECHHVYKDGKNVYKQGDQVEKCAKCHTEATIKEEKKLPADQQKLNLKLAYHNNCIPCHQKFKKENKESKAPTTCAQCHPGSKAE